jgi:hypothetical protein
MFNSVFRWMKVGFLLLFCSAIGMISAQLPSDKNDSKASNVPCYPISVVFQGKHPRAELLQSLFWIEHNNISRIAVFHPEGGVTVLCDFVRLETQQKDGSWIVLIDFDVKTLRLEIMSKEITDMQVSEFNAIEFGYPETEYGSRVRVNLGMVQIK